MDDVPLAKALAFGRMWGRLAVWAEKANEAEGEAAILAEDGATCTRRVLARIARENRRDARGASLLH